MPPGGLWLITDAHWLKFHPSVSSPSVPYIGLPALLRNLQQRSPATILQIHFCEQQACTAAKHCPNHTSRESDFSRASEDCFLRVSIWKRPQLLPFHKRRLVRSEGKKKLDVPASAGRRNTVYWEWNTRISSSSEHNPGSYFSVDTGENNSAWPYGANYVHCTNGSAVFSPRLHVLPELKHPSCSTMGAARVLMSFVPDASIGWHTRWEAQFFTLLNVTAAEQKNSQQSAWSSMLPNAYESKDAR